MFCRYTAAEVLTPSISYIYRETLGVNPLSHQFHSGNISLLQTHNLLLCDIIVNPYSYLDRIDSRKKKKMLIYCW